MVATSVAGYLLAVMPAVFRWAMAFAGVLLVAPGVQSDVMALVVVTPVLLQQILAWRSARVATS